MAEEDTGELRKKKQEQQEKMMEAARAEEQLKAALRIALEEAAYERLMNISYANKEFYINVARRAIMVFRQTGRKLTEEEIVSLIRSLKRQTEYEPTIRFREK